MSLFRFRTARPSGTWAVWWLVALVVLSLLAACGGPAPTAQVIVVTATPTIPPQVVVVTATYTPAPLVVTATYTPAPQVVASETPLPPPTEVVQASTPQSGGVLVQPGQPTGALLQPTNTLPAPAPSDTPVPPPPTDTPVPPPPAATATPKPTTKPTVSLTAYGVVYGNFAGGNEADENKYSVWLMRGDGSEANKVVDKGFEPAFSPQGSKFAYYRCFSGISVFDMNKKTNTEVVSSPEAEFASFSPDGGKLVFHQWVGGWWSQDVNLYIVNADGSGRTQLPQGMRPAWAPKGDLIAFDSCRDNRCGIFVIKPNGQGFRQVTSDGGGKPSWSPDGKKIVYSADAGGDPEIWMVNVDGSGAKQLTNNNGNDTLPVYSPDGQYIYFLSDQNGKGWAIRLMKPDGSGIQTIRQVGVPPRWQFSRLWVGWW